jgi:hypothetical protein
MAVPKKNIEDFFNPRVVDKEKYISEDINYLKDIINKKAGVIDMMSPGPLKDELRGTYDPTQESYEEFLQRQSIPQMDRPLTGQAPSDAILETQRIELASGTRPFQPDKRQLANIKKWEKANPELNYEDLNPSQKSQIRNLGKETVGRGTGSSALSGKDNPQYQALTKEQEKLAKKLYGTTDLNRNQRYKILRGQITEASKVRQFKPGESIIVNQPRDGKVTNITFPEKSDYFKPGETGKEMQKRFEKFIKEKTKQTEKGVTEFTSKQMAQEFPIGERRAKAAQQFYMDKLGLKYAEPTKTQQGEAAKAKADILNRSSSLKGEGIIRTEKTRILKEREMPRKIDFAHRVSKNYMDKLGLKFTTNLTGLDSRLINQIVVQPVETELKNLYRQQDNVVQALQRTNEPFFKEKLEKINDQVTKTVKKTGGRLVGVHINPNTLEPSFVGQKKKYSLSKYLGSRDIKDLENLNPAERSKLVSGIAKSVDAEIKKGFVPNEFKEILSDPKAKKSILEYTKKRAPDIYDDVKKMLENPTSKKALPLYSFPGMLFESGAYKEAAKGGKLLGTKLLQGLVTPAGAALITDVDLKDPMSRVGLGAEAAFAPELVKSTVGLTKGMENRVLQKGIQRLLNLGLSTPMALRLARALQPVGIASLIGEGAYQFGKAQKEYLEGLDPEQRIAVEQEYRDVAAANGGRIGLANGPKDPSKRKFMKIGVGILGALPFGATKLLQKPAVQEAATKAIPAAEAGWSWIKDNFWEVVGTVKNKAKTFAKLKDGEVRIHKDMKVIENPETIRVRYKTDNDNMAETVYTKPYKEVNPETGEIIDIPGDFQEYQDVYRLGDKEVYKDFEEEIIDSVENVKKIIKED